MGCIQHANCADWPSVNILTFTLLATVTASRVVLQALHLQQELRRGEALLSPRHSLQQHLPVALQGQQTLQLLVGGRKRPLVGQLEAVWESRHRMFGSLFRRTRRLVARTANSACRFIFAISAHFLTNYAPDYFRLRIPSTT